MGMVSVFVGVVCQVVLILKWPPSQRQKKSKKMQQSWDLEKVEASAVIFFNRSPLSDFDTADALLVSEVKMLLEHRKAQHESQDDDQDLSEVRYHGWSRDLRTPSPCIGVYKDARILSDVQ